MKVLFLTCFSMLCLSACKGPGKDKVALAKAYGEVLYEEDTRILPSEIKTKEDSSFWVQAFIDNWIKEKVVAHKAELNLSADEKDMSKELEDYRNSLLIYRYKQKLVAERLDTLVAEEEIRRYFEANKSDFETNRNLVRLRFVKLERKEAEFGKIKKLMASINSDDVKKLSDLCEKHTLNYFLDDETWLDFDEVKKELPMQNYSDEHFLQNNKFLEISEGEYIYLVNILDYKVRNKFAMLDPEKDRIRNIILQRRTQALIKEMEVNVVKEAELNKEFEKVQ